jgi:hypothetical protein
VGGFLNGLASGYNAWGTSLRSHAGHLAGKFCRSIGQEPMSQINGDKSRFHRERKQNIHRRLRNRELLEAAGQKVPAVADKKLKAAPSKKTVVEP